MNKFTEEFTSANAFAHKCATLPANVHSKAATLCDSLNTNKKLVYKGTYHVGEHITYWLRQILVARKLKGNAKVL